MTDDGVGELLVDAILIAAAQSMSELAPELSSFEHEQSVRDLAQLSKGGDCYYDRPAIGLHYALWYHPQRTRDLFRVLSPLVARYGEVRRPLHVIDLGAGTGAALSAVRLALARRQRAGQPVPTSVKVTAVESSPFMLDVLEVIDAALVGSTGTQDVSVELVQRSWFSAASAVGSLEVSAPHLVASYAFDHSDRELNDVIADRLRLVGDAVEADSLHLLGPSPKRDILKAVVARMEAPTRVSSSWVEAETECENLEPTTSLRRLGDLRRELVDPGGPVGPLVSKDPTWKNPYLYVQWLRRAPSTLFAAAPLPFGFALDAEQDEAADPLPAGVPRPTVIAGAAGSGKSYVLMEKAARLLESQGDDARVLVTAFNNLMVDELARILQLRCDHLDLVRQGSGFWFDRSSGSSRFDSSVVFCNRDKLPTRIFDMPFGGAVSGVPDDVAREGERFIYGKGLLDRVAYLAAERRGAGTPLSRPRREALWDEFWQPDLDTFTRRRISTLEVVRENGPGSGQRFTQVLVDECQDFTESDYELLQSLVGDPGDITVAGDEAQSLHLGGTYRRPVLNRADGSRTAWEKFELVGAYRMPVAACRAVLPLAEHLRNQVSSAGSEAADLSMPTPRKAAKYGPRPILVEGAQAGSVGALLNSFGRCTADDLVCLTDGPYDLRRVAEQSLVKAGFRVVRENMRLIKGLERSNVVVFGDASPQHDEETAAQCLYTAMTRSTGVTVLIVPPSPSPNIRPALSALIRPAIAQWVDPQRSVATGSLMLLRPPSDELLALA